MKTKKIRGEALESFVTCFNLCYPDWPVDGDAARDLTANEVEYSYAKSVVARCGPRRNGRVYFAIRSQWYGDAQPSDRLGVLIHELAHVEHPDHSPAFWSQVVENYRTLRQNASAVEQVMLGDITWDEVREFLVNDPSTRCVDNRSEIAYERRCELAEALGYPCSEITPFEQMRIAIQDRSGTLGVNSETESSNQSVRRVPLGQLHYEKKELADVVSYFHTRPREYLDRWKRCYVIQPLPGRRNGTQDEFELLDGDVMASLADHAGLDAVNVRLPEEADATGD